MLHMLAYAQQGGWRADNVLDELKNCGSCARAPMPPMSPCPNVPMSPPWLSKLRDVRVVDCDSCARAPMPHVPMSPPPCPLYKCQTPKVWEWLMKCGCCARAPMPPMPPMSPCPNVPMPLLLCPLNVKPQRCEGCPRVQCSSDPESHVQVNPKSSNWSNVQVIQKPMSKWSWCHSAMPPLQDLNDYLKHARTRKKAVRK